jgi:hypothetical protein
LIILSQCYRYECFHWRVISWCKGSYWIRAAAELWWVGLCSGSATHQRRTWGDVCCIGCGPSYCHVRRCATVTTKHRRVGFGLYFCSADLHGVRTHISRNLQPIAPGLKTFRWRKRKAMRLSWGLHSPAYKAFVCPGRSKCPPVSQGVMFSSFCFGTCQCFHSPFARLLSTLAGKDSHGSAGPSEQPPGTTCGTLASTSRLNTTATSWWLTWQVTAGALSCWQPFLAQSTGADVNFHSSFYFAITYLSSVVVVTSNISRALVSSNVDDRIDNEFFTFFVVGESGT